MVRQFKNNLAKTTKKVVKTKYLCIVLIALNSGSLFGQTNTSDTTNKQFIVSHYFTSLDYSSYIDLLLYADGSFTYNYKFEAAGVFGAKGKWKRTKKSVVLYDVEYIAGRQPTLFKRKWFVSRNRICSNKNPEKEDVICLKFQPCE